MFNLTFHSLETLDYNAAEPYVDHEPCYTQLSFSSCNRSLKMQGKLTAVLLVVYLNKYVDQIGLQSAAIEETALSGSS